MINLLGRIPTTEFHVACSGGPDSMALVDFLRRYPKNKFDLIHFNHGTKSCDEAESFLCEFAKKTGLKLTVGTISDKIIPKGVSREDYWRKARYSFFSRFSDKPILLGHHLNDCVETYVMTALQGTPRLIPYSNPKYNVIRPFLLTPHSELLEWDRRHHVDYVMDASNNDVTIKRNYVRKVLMDGIRIVNPGIETTVAKRIRAEYKNSISV